MRFLRSDYWIFVLSAYFALHIGEAAFFGGAVADPVVAPALARSYDGALPLYHWLIASLVPVFGDAPMVLIAFHNALLLLTVICVFRTVARFGRADWAWVAALSFFFVPHFIWVAQHDGGPVLLATALSAASVWAFALIVDRRDFWSYAVFGAVAGLAGLAGLSALIVPVLLVAGAASLRAGWALVFTPRMVLAVALGAGLSVPSLLFSAAPGIIGQAVAGLTDMNLERALAGSEAIYFISQAVIGFAGFLIIGVAYLFHHGLGSTPPVSPPFILMRRILMRVFVFGFPVYLAYLTVAGTDGISYAILQPFLVLLIPLGGFYLVPLLTPYLREMVAKAAFAAAVAVLLASPAQYGKATGGLTAWYLEFRASEGARTPLL